MRKLSLTCSIVLLLANTVFAQTLFTYGKYPVDKKEFVRVYEKNAINKKPDYSRQALREYLDLYALFKMKVKEAELQQIDTISSIQYELDNYRKQLASQYLTDEDVKEKQVEEAYERMTENIKVAHIMIMSSPMAPAKDTVAPYKTIDSLYKAAKGGADFAKLAEAYSDDKSSAVNGGDLGYLTALQTVYAFENVMYATPEGEVSKPFRTQYGYHILKVIDRKPSEGEVEVAQIMIAAPESKGPEARKEAKKEAEEVLTKLKKGADFKKLVAEYSDDNYSKDNDGVLKKFGAGSYVPAFEDAAFGLKKKGDLSAIVETEYGFHILKLINKYPVLPYDSVKVQLAKQVERDERAQIAKEIYYKKIKEKNNFKEYGDNVKKLKGTFADMIPSEGEDANSFAASDFKGPDYVLFKLKGQEYKASDLLEYAEDVTRGRVMGPKEAIYDNIYDNYVTKVVTDIEEQNLIDENPEFKNLMQEYRDGIMLFELMDRNVWGKASKDTTGLKEYYESKKDAYKWGPGFRGAVYTFKNKEQMERAEKIMFDAGMTDEKLIEVMNTKETPDAVSIQRGYYEYAKHKDIKQSTIESGESTPPQRNENGTISVTYPRAVFSQGTTKTLDEARGYVIAEYQDYLEQSWNEKLREKYPVKVNEDVFNSMVKK